MGDKKYQNLLKLRCKEMKYFFDVKSSLLTFGEILQNEKTGAETLWVCEKLVC